MKKRLFCLFSCLALGGPAFADGGMDAAVIRRLNDAFIQDFLNCDVAGYRALLADDFRGVLADGRVIDKEEFLRVAAAPPGVGDFREPELSIRLFGDTAVVNALVTYRRPGGIRVRTRHVEVYVRRAGSWQIVSEQFTRLAEP